jgi:hypothetical protein
MGLRQFNIRSPGDENLDPTQLTACFPGATTAFRTASLLAALLFPNELLSDRRSINHATRDGTALIPADDAGGEQRKNSKAKPRLQTHSRTRLSGNELEARDEAD